MHSLPGDLDHVSGARTGRKGHDEFGGQVEHLLVPHRARSTSVVRPCFGSHATHTGYSTFARDSFLPVLLRLTILQEAQQPFRNLTPMRVEIQSGNSQPMPVNTVLKVKRGRHRWVKQHSFHLAVASL